MCRMVQRASHPLPVHVEPGPPTRHLALRIEHVASGPARGPLLSSRKELVEAAPGGKAGGKEAYFRWAVGPFPSNWEAGSEKFEGEAIRHRASTPKHMGKTVSHGYFSFPLH